jgi:hypothetical protein
MPRPLILDNKTKIDPISISTQSRPKNTLSASERTRILNRKRSDQYVKSMTSLDAGGHVSNVESVKRIIDAIQAEFPEITIDNFPIGIVARCYLGAPYEVHTLDLTGGIIEHYEVFKLLPIDLEKARSLSLHPQYAFVEVYRSGEMRAIEQNGNIVCVEGRNDGIR